MNVVLFNFQNKSILGTVLDLDAPQYLLIVVIQSKGLLKKQKQIIYNNKEKYNEIMKTNQVWSSQDGEEYVEY